MNKEQYAYRHKIAKKLYWVTPPYMITAFLSIALIWFYIPNLIELIGTIVLGGGIFLLATITALDYSLDKIPAETLGEWFPEGVPK